MTDWQIGQTAARERYVDALVGAGWQSSNSDPYTLTKDHFIPALHRHVPLQTTVHEKVPFNPPKVKAEDGSGSLSWHRELDHSLCLWAPAREPERPWMEPTRLLQRIEQWYENDAKEWPDDAPDLDLERYWPPSTYPYLLVHNGLDRFDTGTRVLVCRRKHGPVVDIRLGGSTKGHRAAELGIIADVGELARPVRSVEQVFDLLPYVQRQQVEKLLDKNGFSWFLVRYQRRGLSAVLSLRRSSPTGEWRAVESAAENERALSLRAGPDAPVLATANVVLVGTGAVGSFLADALLRSGVGHLTIIDGERLRPGNLARHYSTARHVGQWKVEATRSTLIERGHDHRKITARRLIADAESLAESVVSADLVIDATSNAMINMVLFEIASHYKRTVLSAAIHNHGAFVRIDRAPLVGQEAWEPPEADHGDDTVAYEGGCGDPVSSTPPTACMAAGALIAAIATAHLAGRLPPPTTRVGPLRT